VIVKLKIKIEEARRTEEVLKSQLEEREKNIERMEEEIVSLRKDLQKKDVEQNNTKILDDIINSQRPYHDRSRIGYHHM
jgi:chromosome segregation ATPase